MSSLSDSAFWHIVGRNLLWMSGNIGLAWAGVLFLWTTQRWSTHPRLCGTAVTVAAAGLVISRSRGGDGVHVSAVVLLGALGLAGIAALWVWRARAGDRWATWLAIAGAVAFAPNAPYVLTDGMHFVQDVRATDVTLAPAVVSALLYGGFLAVSLAAWIVLLDIARQPIAPRWRGPVLVLTSFVVAAGIYIGRIVRVNSWEIVTRPKHVAHALGPVFTDRGPAVFTITWTLVVIVASWIGMLTFDARRHERPRAIAGWVWLLSGALLVGSPQISLLDVAFYDLNTPLPGAFTAGVTAVGLVFVVIGISRLRLTAVRARWRIPVVLGAMVLLGPLLIAGSSLGWWAQYRSLCHYGPDRWLHQERCHPN